MGATQVTVTVRNSADPERYREGLFLVVTGATDCLVPREHLEAIGLKPKAKPTYELADGSAVKLDVTSADYRVHGRLCGGDDDLRLQ
jgi:predicted aspartyl protease